MALDPQLVGAFQLLATVILLIFVKPVVENRDKRESRLFGGLVLASAIWGLGLAGGNFTAEQLLSVVAYNVVLLGAELTAVIWVLLVLEITDRETDRRLVAALFGWVLLMQLLVWTNGIHHRVYEIEKMAEGMVLITQTRPGRVAHFLGSYLLGFVGLGVLVIESIDSSGLRRRQMVLFSLGVLPTMVASGVSLSGLVLPPYDVTPVGFLLTTFVLGFLIFRSDFLDITTVARRTAVEEMDDAMVTLDNKDRVVDCNDRARDLFDIGDGYVGMSVKEFFDPIAADIADLLAEPRSVETDISTTLEDQKRHFSLSVAAIGEDVPDGHVVVLHDVTEQKRRERKLEWQNERLGALFQNTTEAVVEYKLEDGDPVIENVNEAFEALFGYDEVDVAYTRLDDAVPPVDESRAESINEKIRRGERVSREVERETSDGSRTFLFRNAPIEIGDQDRGYALFTDITGRIEREEELERQNEQLDQFASMVSHDLRNPLGVAQTYLQFAEDTGDEADFGTVREAHDRIEAIIDQLLTMARAGTGLETTESLELDPLVETAWDGSQTDGATLERNIPDNWMVEGDRHLLRNVFENLFRNAADHNDLPLRVCVGTLDSGEGFFVEDDGDGIPEDEYEEIFEYGYSTTEDGTGFGLTIVSDLVEAHSWEIEVTDSDEGGARFEIRME